MLKCGITTDNRCLGHNTGVGHPERSDRIRSCFVAIEQANLNLVPVESVPINEETSLCYAKEHIDRVYKHCQTEDPLEYDTPVVKDFIKCLLLQQLSHYQNRLSIKLLTMDFLDAPSIPSCDSRAGVLFVY